MSEDARIARSWVDNADAWVDSVRNGLIPSRRAGTDDAVIQAVLDQSPRRVLDAGCGEGWLARALAERGVQVTGFDGSSELVARARERGGATFLDLSYDDFIAAPKSAGSAFDVVVFNFSLFTQDIIPVLAAAKALLREDGSVIIQTIHPFNDAQDAAYVDGWRFQGINVWANWIAYIRSRGRVSAPSLLVDDVLVNPDATITVFGRWRGVRFGRSATSLPGAARYRLERGRIVEIWSTRRNYSFLCGMHTVFHSGFALELLRLQWVRRRATRLDLRQPSRHRRPPAPPANAQSR